MPAPIALFTYNRPEHTMATIAALAGNPLAAESELVVFSDAAKVPGHQEDVQTVRQLLRSVHGFRSVSVVERESNFGLARSIIDGVTRLCNSHGRVIVLEDDLTAATCFLRFMNDALSRYASEPQVMQITGYMFPAKGYAELPQAFFSRLPASWGWATWSRAWAHFQPDAASLLERLSARGGFWEFDVKGTYGYAAMLRAQANGLLDSWAIRWYASMFLMDGLCLRPSRSLVRNTGFDGTGVHCDVSHDFDVELSDAPVTEFPELVEEYSPAVHVIAAFHRSIQPSRGQRFIARATRWLRRLSPWVAGR
jgi:hypothetical protein